MVLQYRTACICAKVRAPETLGESTETKKNYDGDDDDSTHIPASQESLKVVCVERMHRDRRE